MKCNSIKTQLLLLALLSVFQVTISHAGIIRIDESEFIDAETLSFGPSDKGPISGTDDLFTNFGISDISAKASQSFGEEYARGDSQYVLWADSNDGVQVVEERDGCDAYSTDPKFLDKCVGNRTLAKVDFYDVNFSDDLTKIGFHMVDIWKPLEFTFYLDGAIVGEYDEDARGDWDGNTTGTGLGWTQWRAFSSDIAFDQIKIQSTAGAQDDGFGIAQIRKEAISVPEPSSVMLLAASLFGFLSTRRRILDNNK
jgi:hypothetical protein